jgi:serine/threonine-protein kinase
MAEQVVGGYRMLKHLVDGQTSQVWEVVEPASGVHFAMKMLRPEKRGDPDKRRFLLHDAEVGRQLAHPNIIRIVAVDTSRDNPYYVMEFFPSGTLKRRIQYWSREVDFIYEYAHDILKQAATALAFMNAQGWVHRDVKPENMLVNSVGEVRLIDFALAQRIPTGWSRFFRRRQQVQGTRSYMSPEQVRGQALDGRADIYSFGVTAYELVTGHTPFTAPTDKELLHKQLKEPPPTPRQRNPDVTEEFANLILRMLAKNKEDRPRNFHNILMELRTIRVFKSAQLKRSAN